MGDCHEHPPDTDADEDDEPHLENGTKPRASHHKNGEDERTSNHYPAESYLGNTPDPVPDEAEEKKALVPRRENSL